MQPAGHVDGSGILFCSRAGSGLSRSGRSGALSVGCGAGQGGDKVSTLQVGGRQRWELKLKSLPQVQEITAAGGQAGS
jgi:hypothetical protein